MQGSLFQVSMISHPPGRLVQGNVQCNHRSILKQVVQRAESVRSFDLHPRRVVLQDLEPQGTGHPVHPAADIPDSDYSYLLPFQAYGLPRSNPVQGGKHIVHHPSCIATGSTPDTDPLAVAIREIDVVGTDRGSRDELHAAAFQQVGIALRPGPDHQCVSICDILAADLLSRPVQHIGVRFEHSLDERDGIIYHDLDSLIHIHLSIISLTNSFPSPSLMNRSSLSR